MPSEFHGAGSWHRINPKGLPRLIGGSISEPEFHGTDFPRRATFIATSLVLGSRLPMVLDWPRAWH